MGLAVPHCSFHDKIFNFSPFYFFFLLKFGFFWGGGRYRDKGHMQKDREMNRIKIHDVKTLTKNKKENGIFTVFLVPYCLQFNSINNLQFVFLFSFAVMKH